MPTVSWFGSGTHYGVWHSYGSVSPPAWQDPELLAHPDGPDAHPDPKAGARATSKLAVLHLAHAWQTCSATLAAGLVRGLARG